jgi:hypothetical protein
MPPAGTAVPATEPDRPNLADDDEVDDDGQAEENSEGASRRVRSTRRRSDAADLPQVPMGTAAPPSPNSCTGTSCDL